MVEALKRAGVPADKVDEVIFGQVLQAVGHAHHIQQLLGSGVAFRAGYTGVEHGQLDIFERVGAGSVQYFKSYT